MTIRQHWIFSQSYIKLYKMPFQVLNKAMWQNEKNIESQYLHFHISITTNWEIKVIKW